jgi:hypothetical protein
MPFGRYRGARLADLPTSYLQWLLTIDLQSWLRQGVEAELHRRGTEAAPPPLPWKSLVKTWYGRMAMQLHPDRGGDHKSMLVVNACRDALVELLENAG